MSSQSITTVPLDVNVTTAPRYITPAELPPTLGMLKTLTSRKLLPCFSAHRTTVLLFGVVGTLSPHSFADRAHFPAGRVSLTISVVCGGCFSTIVGPCVTDMIFTPVAAGLADVCDAANVGVVASAATATPLMPIAIDSRFHRVRAMRPPVRFWSAHAWPDDKPSGRLAHRVKPRGMAPRH